MKLLDEYIVKKKFDDANFGIDDLKFLEYSGRQSFYSQGYYGQETICAVIDTGVSKHEEFEERLLEGRNVNKSYNDTSNWKDDGGHGTHVASSIAGKNVGIAPQAKILPVKSLDENGGTNRILDVVDGVKWAREWRSTKGEKVDVISMSLSGTKSIFGSYLNRFENEINKCVEEGVLVVCSMGNTGEEEKRYPAYFDEVVAVGAVDVNQKQAEFTTIGNHIDVCQIGVDIIGANYGGGYVSLSGTSMATPLVSGIACLLAGRHKIKFGERMSEQKLYEQIKMNTKDLGIEGADKIYGVGFASVQPLSMDIELTIGSDKMTVNEKEIALDSPPILYNNRFYVPLRWIITFLGGYIKFDNKTSKAIFRM